MIRFKKLLENKSVNELRNLLQNEFVVYDKPLYRGSTKEIMEYEVLTPRSNRFALSTRDEVQYLLSVVNDEFFPSHPNRARSKFASASRDLAASYGHVYYFFPHKNAKVSFYPKDTYKLYFSRMSGEYASADRDMGKWEYDEIIDILKEDLSDELSDVLFIVEGIWRFMLWEDEDYIKNAIEKNYQSYSKIIKDFEKMVGEIEDKGLYDYISSIKKLASIFKSMGDYFKGADSDFIGGRSEVVVERQYLIVNEEFFENQIVYDEFY